MFKLSPDQKKILTELLEWTAQPKGHITFGGYAGTGKTTLIGQLRKQIHKQQENISVAFCTYTGKASRVLKEKIIEANALYKQDSVSTIHSLIYSPITNAKEEIIGWKKKDHLNQDLIIIDEASMLDETIWNDLQSYLRPIIAVGDHGQLPPIKGKFNLMEKPKLKLETIHRQALDNPIIRLSVMAREKGQIPFGQFGAKIKKLACRDNSTAEEIESLLSAYSPETLVLCGYNNTRINLNKHIRYSLGYESQEPQTGDRVICLRNNHEKQIFNGMIGTLKSLYRQDEQWFDCEILMDGDEKTYHGLIAVNQFNNHQPINFTQKRALFHKGDLFDFGYALTVHKAQGSQAKQVILFEEKFSRISDDIWRRWLYTAITRAREELYIFA